MKIERLYGVQHGAKVEMDGIMICDLLIAPSRELMRDLLTLPSGTSVGIETCPELLGQPLEIQGETMIPDESNKFYWRRIVRLCQRRNLNVIYLEDLATYKRYAEKTLERELLHAALEEQFRSGGKPEKVLGKMYTLQVEAEHIFLFEREEKFLDKIQETQPAVVILGKKHSDPLSLNPEQFNNRGISVGEYKTEEIFISPSDWDILWRYQRAELAYQSEPDEKILLDRDSIKRKFRAVNEGRVTADGTPNYIGTWDTEIPARGLFEVYSNGDGRMGTIEDCNGTAAFLGNITDDSAIFVKKYDPNKSGTGVAQDNIIYEGSSVGKEVVGEFRSPQVGSGRFRLRKFDGNPLFESV